MPRTTLQTGDDPDRLTGSSGPVLAERLTSLLTEFVGLVDDINELDDVEGEHLLEAAELFAATVRDRWPDPDGLATAHRAMVAQYLADDFDGRHLALTATSRRGPVTIGDTDMRVTRLERALLELAPMIGQQFAAVVERHLWAEDDR